MWRARSGVERRGGGTSQTRWVWADAAAQEAQFDLLSRAFFDRLDDDELPAAVQLSFAWDSRSSLSGWICV